jgi:hypothetical protein
MSGIIANAMHGDNQLGNVDKAFAFLDAFHKARNEMDRAAKAMEDFIKVAHPDSVAAYKRAHHKMVRIRREWNKIEHEREMPSPEQESPTPA